MIYVIPANTDKDEVRKLLTAHPEIRFVSLMGVDMAGNDTDEKIPARIFVKDMDNLKIYKRPMFLPTLENDEKKPNKKTGSVVCLLTPNRESSVKLMTHPMTVNKTRYQSYYVERDLTYFIRVKYLKRRI